MAKTLLCVKSLLARGKDERVPAISAAQGPLFEFHSLHVSMALVRTWIALLMLVGCQREPTIVVRFEPTDLGKRDAATRPPDLAVRDAQVDAAVVVASKSKKSECQNAADCALVPEDCCDCASGGKQRAVPKAQVASLKAQRAKKCKQAMCTMMMSTDPSCAKRAGCISGACQLVK